MQELAGHAGRRWAIHTNETTSVSELVQVARWFWVNYFSQPSNLLYCHPPSFSARTWNNRDYKVAGKGHSMHLTWEYPGMSDMLCKPCSLRTQEALLQRKSLMQNHDRSQIKWAALLKQGRAQSLLSLPFTAAQTPALQAQFESQCTGSRLQAVIINSIRCMTCKIHKVVPIRNTQWKEC